ncbi:hypothetical protein [Lutibacter sp.]|uniref:hypothetical protein n=1 Tax=Lutibacter sp. TaxID=1925666 RepID=UPI0025C1E912|nr:hypothetical protein [Lutibacter sp.]MCF6167248.1 hypothetical protein [Lutibacter sp.]
MKTKLSNKTVIKYFNEELSEYEMKRVKSIINNSDYYKSILNELKITYRLIGNEERLENNPYLYIEIINKLTDKENQSNLFNSYFIKNSQLIVAVLVLLITLYSGFSIGNIYHNTNELSSNNYKTEFYFNDLQLERMESVLLIKE